MFKHAYVRGVQNALIQAGHCAFPDEETAAKVADYIANETNFEPGPSMAQALTAKIANAVLEASKWFKDNGHKTASFRKLASLDDLSKLAHQHTIDLMQKAAEGSTIEGGDKGNKEPDSTHAEAKMDLGQRPTGYATDSQGKTDVDTRPGAVGKEQEHPNKPSESPAGDNSVKEQSRTASLESFLKKTAEGSTLMGGDKGNKEPTTGEGQMDLKQRPAGYAAFGAAGQGSLGELMKRFDGQSAVGKEQPHPNAPSRSPSGSNSVTETSGKHAEEKLSADEQAYLHLFKKTASEIGEYLPAGIGDEAKIAHVRACMGMTTEEKAHYLHGLQKEAVDKTASTPAAVPPGSRTDGYASHSPDASHSRPGAYDGRKANQGTKQAGEGELPAFMKKDDEKKDDGDKKDAAPEEKKEEDKKEAGLGDHLRRIASSIRPTATA